MDITWGCSAIAFSPEWVVVDVETSGLHPNHSRIVSLAAVVVDSNDNIKQKKEQLVNAGVDPGPSHIHGITRAMLENKPQFHSIIDDFLPLLSGKIFVAHNARFDYEFLAHETKRAAKKLPVDFVMCTVELSKRLGLGLDNYRLETVAHYWGITQQRPHDALDDAYVTAQILIHSLQRARRHDVWLPIRPVSYRYYPDGTIKDSMIASLKTHALYHQCPYQNPGRYDPRGFLIQGMRVGLTTGCTRSHEELIERILSAGLAYTDHIDTHTSLILGRTPEGDTHSDYLLDGVEIPIVPDEQFLSDLREIQPGTLRTLL